MCRRVLFGNSAVEEDYRHVVGHVHTCERGADVCRCVARGGRGYGQFARIQASRVGYRRQEMPEGGESAVQGHEGLAK